MRGYISGETQTCCYHHDWHTVELVTNLDPLFKIFELFKFFLCFLIMWNQKTCLWVIIHNEIYHMHADVGPRWPEGFPCHRRRGRGDDIMGVDAEHTLQRIHNNFMRLTHRVPMVQVKDLPETMQCQVVGVP